jgi:hypothetical protein
MVRNYYNRKFFIGQVTRVFLCQNFESKLNFEELFFWTWYSKFSPFFRGLRVFLSEIVWPTDILLVDDRSTDIWLIGIFVQVIFDLIDFGWQTFGWQTFGFWLTDIWLTDIWLTDIWLTDIWSADIYFANWHLLETFGWHTFGELAIIWQPLGWQPLGW